MRYLSKLALCFVMVPVPLVAQSADEIAFMKTVLSQVQTLTIKAGREFCGYVLVDDEGQLRATNARRGRKNSCRARDPGNRFEVIASYHSHGTFHHDADSEVPSSDDMLADQDEGVNGWVVTPGGRIWYIDADVMETFQVCGQGCVEPDPSFEPEMFGPVEQLYSLSDLKQREE